MFKHVLIATDGSELSEKTVRAGLVFARSLDARVTLLHVTPPASPQGISAEGVLREIREHEEWSDAQARLALEAAIDEARRRGVRCEGIQRVGADPWRAIIDVAAELHCDLVMMASHGRRGLDALLVGSETNKVLSHSKIPVLVYR